VAKIEPAVRCVAALHSPSTGILDVPDYANVMLADIEAAGGELAFRATVESAAHRDGEFQLQVRTEDDVVEMACGLLINSAGLEAVPLASRLAARDPGQLPPARFAKGSYFSCRGRSPFRHLIYPMPNEAGLGVHATRDMGGRLRFGPDVEWVQVPEYGVEAARAKGFYSAIREYWPGLPDDSLQPDYAGVRPKIVGPGETAADFLIEGPAAHGIPGLVNLLGIESPGLTSSRAIAEHVASLLSEAA
jgi:L-2-hydroxyglutarate oxidase LhgO